MKYTTLGKTDIKVSRLCVGATTPVHFKDATQAVDLKLSAEDIAFLGM